MTTIQIHTFMAGAKWKKCPAFCFRKQKTQEPTGGLPSPTGTKANILQTGVLHMLT